MKALTFCINGKMAHFRKYYSNSSVLSYLLPPVTTVKGILAGLLGMPRDSYYELFSNANCKMAILLDKPARKITQSLNLLLVEDTPQGLNGCAENRSPTSTELIIPENIRSSFLSYRIYFWHRDDTLMQKLYQSIFSHTGSYQSKGISLGLGSAYCLGWLSGCAFRELTEVSPSESFEPIYGAVLNHYIESITFLKMQDTTLSREETLTEFDQNRRPTLHSKKEIIVNAGPSPLSLKLKKGTVCYMDGNKKFMFLE